MMGMKKEIKVCRRRMMFNFSLSFSAITSKSKPSSSFRFKKILSLIFSVSKLIYEERSDIQS